MNRDRRDRGNPDQDLEEVPMIFGEPWGGARPVQVWPRTPVHARCMRCGERIVEDDRGFIRRPPTMIDADYLVGTDEDGAPLTAIHRECDLAEWIGRVVGVDPDHGWDHSRDSAREAERRFNQFIRTHGESVVPQNPDHPPPAQDREDHAP